LGFIIMKKVDKFWKRIYRKNGDIVVRKIAEEVILVPIRGNIGDMQRIFTLNPVAELIWEELDGKKTLNDIRQHVIEIFEVKEVEAEKDIMEFMEQLHEYDLVANT